MLVRNRVSVPFSVIREEYGIMRRIKAKWIDPLLDDIFRRPATWSSLSLREVQSLKRKRAEVHACPSAAEEPSLDDVFA